MSRIDYSKWDHLDDASSSSDEQSPPDLPRVTKFDQPSRVTTQSDGSLLIRPSTPPPPPIVSSLTTISTTSTAMPPQKPSGSSETNAGHQDESAKSTNRPHSRPPPAWTEKGGCSTIREGAHELYWSQDRYSVTIRIQIPTADKQCVVPLQATTKACKDGWNVHVSGMLSYADRHCAVMGHHHQQQEQPPRLLQVTRAGAIWWQDTLLYPVHHAADDDDEDDNVEWCVEETTTTGSSYLTVVLYKAVPMHGMTVWWKRPVASCPDVPQKDKVEGSSLFAKAWNEAHEQFRNQIKTKTTPTVI
jgi:hypothetical protein